MKRIIAVAVVAASIAMPVSADEHRVTIRNMTFEPNMLGVATGDTVVFVNAGRSAHTPTATGGAFDGGGIRSGEAVRVTISATGFIDFICEYHPSMCGQIVAN